MSEHRYAGHTMYFTTHGVMFQVEIEDGLSHEEGEEFMDLMYGLGLADYSIEVDHPDLEFADVLADGTPRLEGFRTLCRLGCCHETKVFDSLNAIKESEWTELEFGIGILADKTVLNYGYCPGHSLTEEEGYEPEKDPGSTEYLTQEEQTENR